MSDPNQIQGHFNNIIDNLISSGIVWLVGMLYTGLGYGEQPQSKDLNSLLKQAIEDENYNYEWEDEEQFEEVGLFLLSPEAQHTIRQIFSAKLENDLKGIEEVRQQFSIQLALSLDVTLKSISKQSSRLFEQIVGGCEKVFVSAIDHGILSAHEALSVQRHHIILDELRAVRKNLELMSSNKKPNLREIIKFETIYRKQVEIAQKDIEPPTYNTGKRRVHINSLYVKGSFIPNGSDQSNTIPFDEFTKGIFRTVILGNPGGGKSTFASKLAYDLATGSSNLSKNQLTPILVVLRDYGVEKKLKNWSAIQYIEAKTREIYQLNAPHNSFEYMLLNGRAMVIFDGLDELLDTTYRQEITQAIELFCNLFPATPILVTSREVGYDQAPLSNDLFDIFKLAPLDRDQTQQYVENFFYSDENLPLHQRKQLSKGFVEESKNVPDDLISSPLLLALMCNLYRGPGTLPQNRPEIYLRCSEMLFDRWDTERKIIYNLPFEKRIRPAMRHLAYWIYQDADLQNGVTEKKLVDKTAEYLLGKRFDDEDEAIDAAQKFINFCTGRAWVFTDTGTTRTGEKLYQFTHRTFLEYFTASHLVRIYHNPSELLEILLPRIAVQEWDTVAQLAFQQLSDAGRENDGDELLIALIEKASSVDADTANNLLSFSARCLAFIFPSQQVVRRITQNCIEWCTSSLDTLIDEKEYNFYLHTRSQKVDTLIDSLISISNENLDNIRKTIETTLIDILQHSDEVQSYAACEISLGVLRHSSNRLEGVGNNISNEILSQCHDQIYRKFAHKYPGICMMLFRLHSISISDIVNWYGIQIIFSEYRFKVTPHMGYSPIASMLLSIGTLSESLKKGSYTYLKQQLKLLHEVFMTSSLPLVDKVNVGELRGFQLWREDYNQPYGETLFSCFVIMAIIVESSFTVAAKAGIKKHPIYKTLAPIYSARLRPSSDNLEIQEKLDSCEFNSEQQAYILRWVSGEINFVKLPIKQKRKQQKKISIE